MAPESNRHNFVIPDELWNRARIIADGRYEKLSDVVRRALLEYVEKYS